jgi:hypothetical protein
MATTTNYGWTTPDDSDPFKLGASAIRTLGSNIDTTAANTWKAWSAYTPTFSGFTPGNATLSFAFAQIGKTVHVRGAVTLGSTSVMTGPLDVSLPVTSVAYSLAHVFSYASFYNGSAFNQGFALSISNANFVRLSVMNTGGTFASASDVSTSTPFGAGGWSSGRQFFFTMTYQAA